MRARKGLCLLLSTLVALPALGQAEPQLAPLGAQAPALSRPPWMRKARLGTLVLKSATAGATVFVDGLDVGLTPLAPLTLKPGKHEVKLSKPGYRDLAQRVTIAAGKKARLSLDLKRIKGYRGPELPPAATPALPALPPLAAAEPPPSATPPMVAPPPLPEIAPQEVAKVAPPPPAKVAEPLPAPPLIAAAKPPPAQAPLAVEPAGLRPSVPAAAVETSAEARADTPLTRRWYFWGGAAVAAAVVAAGVVYALPARYVEKRDPTAACGGPCGIVINNK